MGTTMHTTAQILDAARDHSGLASDYKLGLVLGLSNSAVSNYRHGRSHPDDEVAVKLAELANLDRGYVVACIHAERAGANGMRELWQYVAGRLASNGIAAGQALMAAILAVAFTGGPDAGASVRTDAAASRTGDGLYIMSTKTRAR